MTHTNPTSIRDWGVSWLRTVVPAGWGFVLAFLATRAPAVYEALDNPAVAAAVTGVAVAAWYSLFRWLEPHLSPFLTRLVLGSNKQPNYQVVPGEVLNSSTEMPRRGLIE